MATVPADKTGIFSNSVDPDEDGSLLYDLRRPLEQDVNFANPHRKRSPRRSMSFGTLPRIFWPLRSWNFTRM